MQIYVYTCVYIHIGVYVYVCMYLHMERMRKEKDGTKVNQNNGLYLENLYKTYMRFSYVIILNFKSEIISKYKVTLPPKCTIMRKIRVTYLFCYMKNSSRNLKN